MTEVPAGAAGLPLPLQGPAKPAKHHTDDPRREIRFGVAVIVAFFGVFGGWAAFAPLDAAVVAPGVVVVSGSRQTVQHPDGGVVRSLAVREGDRVEKGQVLLELATNDLAAAEESLAVQVIEMEALRARLLAEGANLPTVPQPASWADMPPEHRATAAAVLSRQQVEMQARRNSLSSQLAVLAQRSEQLSARISGYQSQIASVSEQSRLIQDEVTGVRSLAERGLVPLPRLRALERSAAELQGQRGELSASIEQAREGIGETRLEAIAARQRLAEDRQAQIREADTQLATLQPKLRATRDQLERSRVRAPATGRVVALTAFTIGGVIRPGDRILDIVPEQQPLVVEAQVSPADVDDLRIGQKTEVRFSAFKGRNVPIVDGAVTRISADRFQDEQTGVAYFKAEVVVPREELARLEASAGQGERELKAGLPVEMVVPLRKRTALQYLLEPLNQTLWRSFRES
jgi:HlyD family secretion protein